ncbi:glutaryl-CoA dehydrogenase [Microbacterium sp. SYP-A9085]|uniref:acyl-CoA dehydrogenase family protein n=1 Tax=Microbacterium sp. SYP-A9085 TaxID=2664454 RepID=UPI00129BFDB9|nr:acyl-CoA dehydrogenase family protein [Microbacterium sp. SYP-A9085]MRH29006.1 glutaryl-CoA dehydrogenase [Microbacterium sp. SYP-A9085]
MTAAALDYPGDLLGFADDLTDAERDKLALLRAYLDEHVRPVLVDRWERGENLADFRAPLAALHLLDDPDLLDGNGALRPLYRGYVTLELCRLDLAMSITYGGQVGMFRTLVHAGGSPEQIAAWDPGILDFSFTGCFALSEPDHGSDVAGGLETTARRDGADWVIDGAKRWIGNATISDNIVVVAREDGSERVLAFVVPADAPGLHREVIAHKGAARLVHNADITLQGVRVGEDRRLPRIESFRDINRAFRELRATIVWAAAGMQLGAYRAAADYAQERRQFGRPIAGFQLIQDKLVRITANIAQTLALAVRTTTHPLQDDVTPSLLKLIAADRLRESAALAREIMGGNGILLTGDAMRFFADAEAMYTFEGTREMNTLIVGRALTGLGAFTR